jgi:hypothetical protein
MRNNTFLITLCFIIGFTACTPDKKQNEQGEKALASVSQSFEYQSSFTTLTWTAFKTTARKGVRGTFKEFQATPGKAGSVKDILLNLQFNINTSSTDSKEADRDAKIVKYFFGTMMNTNNIIGSITSVDGTDSSGKARVSITMNEVTHEVDANYELEGTLLRLKTTIALGDWKAEPSVSALNKICDDLHKGDDGVSKLWPEVDIMVESILKVSAPI